MYICNICNVYNIKEGTILFNDTLNTFFTWHHMYLLDTPVIHR